MPLWPVLSSLLVQLIAKYVLKDTAWHFAAKDGVWIDVTLAKEVLEVGPAPFGHMFRAPVGLVCLILCLRVTPML